MVDTKILMQSLGALKNAIQSKAPIDEAELAQLLPYIEYKSFEKNELFIQEGEIENYIYFLVEGVTRSFFFKAGKDISFEFYFSGSFISSYASFLDRTPSAHAIESFTPTTTLRIPHEAFISLAMQSPKIERIRRLFTEELFKKSSERVKDLISLSATERYQKLLNAYPQYVKNIPLKYLASYLNITPESLSRIRKANMQP
jgi:CRP-like cAMP-binding protein